MERKYKHLEIKVKSTPFIGRGKGVLSWLGFGKQPEKVERSKVDVRGKPCPPGYYPERDGCVPAKEGEQQGGDKPAQLQQKPAPKQSSQQRPVADKPAQSQETKQPASTTTESGLPKIPKQNLGKLDTSKIQEIPKPRVDDVIKNGGSLPTPKFSVDNKMKDEKIWDNLIPPKSGINKNNCGLLTGMDSEWDKAYVSITNRSIGGEPVIRIGISNDSLGLQAARFIMPGGIIHNESFIISHENQGKGIGTEFFSRQVDIAVKSGFKAIECVAERDDDVKYGMNGYYTWPRLGYDAKLNKELLKKAKDAFPNAKTVQDLFKTKEGREWWKENGVSTTMTFDLTEGSQSRKILAAYQEERKNRQKKLTSMRTKKLPWMQYGKS